VLSAYATLAGALPATIMQKTQLTPASLPGLSRS
jgi:hypothetical protein